MLQRVEFLAPSGFRQLDHHPVIQDQVPAPLGDIFISRDPGGGGAMRHHRIHQIGSGIGRAGPYQLGQPGEFLRPQSGDDATGAFHHGHAFRGLPQSKGPLLDHRDENGVGVAAHPHRRTRSSPAP